MKYNELPQNIKKYRKQRGFTQKQLGEKIFKSEILIRKYESGKTNIPPSVLNDIGSALNVTIVAILGNDFYDYNMENFGEVRNSELLKKKYYDDIRVIDIFKEMIRSCGFSYEEYRDPSEGYDNVYITKIINDNKKTLELTYDELEYLCTKNVEYIKKLISEFNGIPNNPLNEND